MLLSAAVSTFLALPRIAVVGVSRSGASPANAIATRLRETQHTVFAVNRTGEEIDGQPTYRSLGAIPGGVDGIVVVTRPSEATTITREAKALGIPWIWFHQGLGPESYDEETLQVARDEGLNVIAAGCPMMYLRPDVFHRCARAVFRWTGRIPRDVPNP